LAIGIVLVVMIATFKSSSVGREDLAETEGSATINGQRMLAPAKKHQKLRKAIPPVTGLSAASPHTAGTALLDEDFVLGVELAGETRAYAINMMGKPESELLNDTLAGRPIAVTFCGTCQSALVFARTIENKTLTLQLSGELLGENMMMRDIETGSDWVQLTGEAIQGPLKGRRLEQIPSVWTDWKTWRDQHPHTTVPDLPNVVQNYRHHPLYSAFPAERSFFADIQWGLAREQKARSWPFAHLDRQPVVNDVFSDQPLLIVFDRRTSTARAYDRRAGDVELTFRLKGNDLADDQTGTIWDPTMGLGVNGPLKGRRLAPVAGTISLNWAWKSFHPEGEIWSAEELPRR
jgi:hypothetical protein